MVINSSLTKNMSKKQKSLKKENVEVKQVTKDKSKFVYQDEKLNWKLSIRERDDFTEKQKVILETCLDSHTRAVFIDGLWGSAKTYNLVLSALKLLNMGKVDGIIYIRNPIESSSTGKVGLLPGTISEKLEPYNAVLYDKLEEFLPKSEIKKLELENRIECIPLSFVRGRSWNCKAIIVDEAASMTYDDLLLLISRCGEFTRIFFAADTTCQNDIGSKSGYAKMFKAFDDMCSKENGIYTFELKEASDILRSGFLRFVMEKLGILKYGI